jgi:cleavage stimulation factor subunit 2
MQAQIMLGMVTPQMVCSCFASELGVPDIFLDSINTNVGLFKLQMQMAKNQQPSSSLAQSSHLNESFPQPDALIPALPIPPQNPNALQEPPLHNFPQYQHTSQPPLKMFPHGHQSGVMAHPPILSQPFGTSSSVPTQPLATSVGLISQVQPPFLPAHPRLPVMPTNVQQLPLTNPHLPQVFLFFTCERAYYNSLTM